MPLVPAASRSPRKARPVRAPTAIPMPSASRSRAELHRGLRGVGRAGAIDAFSRSVSGTSDTTQPYIDLEARLVTKSRLRP